MLSFATAIRHCAGGTSNVLDEPVPAIEGSRGRRIRRSSSYGSPAAYNPSACITQVKYGVSAHQGCLAAVRGNAAPQRTTSVSAANSEQFRGTEFGRLCTISPLRPDADNPGRRIGPPSATLTSAADPATSQFERSAETLGHTDGVSFHRPQALLLDVQEMMCGGGAASVKNMLLSHAQVQTASVNLVTETAAVILEEGAGEAGGEELAKMLTDRGFPSTARKLGQADSEGEADTSSPSRLASVPNSKLQNKNAKQSYRCATSSTYVYYYLYKKKNKQTNKDMISALQEFVVGNRTQVAQVSGFERLDWLSLHA